MIKKTLRIYYMISFIIELSASFFFAVYAVFLVSRGMNLLEISLINGFFMISVLFSEVPTGALADSFGRKSSIVAGCFILAAGKLLYFLSHTFWLLVLSEVVLSVAVSFFTGSKEAWVVDSLKFYGYKGKLEDIFKKECRFATVGVIIGSLSGAYIGCVDISFPWLMGAVSLFFCGIFCWIVMKEEYFSKKKFKLDFSPISCVIKDSITFGWKKKSVLYMILFGTIISFSCMPFNMYWQLIFKDTYNFSVSSLGWIFVGIAVFSLIGSQVSVWFGSMFKKEKNAIVLTQAITAAGMILASLVVGWFSVLAAFLIHEIGRGAIFPLKQAYLNRRIPSEKRATVLSFDSMVNRVGAFSGLLLMGLIANSYSITTAWFFAGLILAVNIPIFLKLKNGEERGGENGTR